MVVGDGTWGRIEESAVTDTTLAAAQQAAVDNITEAKLMCFD
jgi:hypothetical protein